MAKEDPFGWRGSMLLSAAPMQSHAALSHAAALEDTVDFDGARYDKVALIGQGGMGQVWLGWDNVIKRNVAIKIPLGDHASMHANRLMREVLLMARLEHPGIVAVHDVYQDDARPNFVMALVRGQTLEDLLESRERALLTHMLQICEAIGHAHQNGIIHRDITPRNVLVSEDGNAKVIDWGLAVAAEDEEADRVYAGTRGFIAPEVQQGERVTPRSDVWSLGALLQQIIERTETNDAALSAIARRAMASKPERRYADARALGDELRRWFEGRRVDAYDVTLWRQTRRFVKLYRRVILASLLVVFAVIASLTWGVVRSNEEAHRARLAEQSAQRASQRASQANQTAQKTLGIMHRRAAKRALHSGNYREARREIDAALRASRTPEVLGVLASIEMTPEATKQLELQYGPCENRRILTDRPEQWICRRDTKHVELWEGTRRVWSITVDFISKIDVIGDKMYILTGYYYVAYDVQTGKMLWFDHREGRLAHFYGNTRTSLTRDVVMDEMNVELRIDHVCPDRAVHFVSQLDNTYMIFCEHSVWALQPDGQKRRLDLYIKDKPVHAAKDHRGRLWVVNASGDLVMEGGQKIFRFGESMKSLTAIKGTPYLVAHGLKGRVRVFDVRQRDWVLELPHGAKSSRVLPDGSLSLLWADGRMQQWSFDKNHPIWRYRHNENGFAHVTWTRDGKRVCGVDGASFVHVIEPHRGKVYQPTPMGRLVGKWVTTSIYDQHCYAAGIDSFGVFKVSTDEQTRKVRLSLVHQFEHAIRRFALFADHSVGFVHTGSKIHYYQGGQHDRLYRRHIADDVLLQAIDMEIEPSHNGALLVLKNSIAYWSPPALPIYFMENAKRYYAGSIDRMGRVALVNREEVGVYKQDQLINRWPLKARPVDVAWRPGFDQVVTGNLNGEVSVWDISGKLLLRAQPHSSRVGTLAVSKDGQYLATVGWDGHMYILDLSVIERY